MFPRTFFAFQLRKGGNFAKVRCETSILASMVKFVESQDMVVERLKKQIQLMKILVAGCKKHPAYRAIRPATGTCGPCVKIWKARLELNDMEKQC